MPVIQRESRNIFSDNPCVFMLDLQDAILEGYRVENTIPGFPSLNAILKEVKVFKPEVADLERPRPDANMIVVSNYDSMVFLLDVQAAILSGYRVDAQSVKFDNPKVCKLFDEVQEPQDTRPAEELLKEQPKPAAKPKTSKTKRGTV